MPTRTLKQINTQLAKTDKQSVNLLNKQIKSLPGQLAGQKKGLEAQQTKAFGNILSGAKGRGLKFSGIPLAEQAEYTSTNFLPALAGLENQMNNQRFGLQGAMADIIRQRGTTAQSLYQTELDRAFQAEENAKSRAASARAAALSAPDFSSLFGSSSAAPAASQAQPSKKQINQQVLSDASSYAKRIQASLKDPNTQKNILNSLRQGGVKRNDFATMARYNALADLLKLNTGQRFNLDNGSFVNNTPLSTSSGLSRLAGMFGSNTTSARF